MKEIPSPDACHAQGKVTTENYDHAQFMLVHIMRTFDCTAFWSRMRNDRWLKRVPRSAPCAHSAGCLLTTMLRRIVSCESSRSSTSIQIKSLNLTRVLRGRLILHGLGPHRSRLIHIFLCSPAIALGKHVFADGSGQCTLGLSCFGDPPYASHEGLGETKKQCSISTFLRSVPHA